jgi:hypothetical protein
MIAERYSCKSLSQLSPEMGRVVQQPGSVPTFKTDILAYWDALASWQITGETGIGWFELKRRTYEGREVERHLLTPEALMCFQGSAAVLVGRPKDPSALQGSDFDAFYLEQGQGIVLAPGAWHALPFPLNEKAVFGVIFRKGTAHEDLQVLDLEEERGFHFALLL